MSLTYAAQQANSTRKTGAIVIVALLHVGFFYAFTHGLNVVEIMTPIKDTVTVFIPEEKPPLPEPPKPVVKPLDTPIDTMVPEVTPPVEMEIPAEVPVTVNSTAAITANSGEVPADPVAPARSFSVAHQVNPTYPAASRRAGEAGSVLLNIIVGPDGKPTDVSVERSSGFAALDEAATNAVRKWRFKVVSDSQYSRVRLPITFKLETTG